MSGTISFYLPAGLVALLVLLSLIRGLYSDR